MICYFNITTFLPRVLMCVGEGHRTDNLRRIRIRFCAGYQPGLRTLSARLDLRNKIGRAVTWQKIDIFLRSLRNLRIDKNASEWLYNKVAECLSPPASSYTASVSHPDTLSVIEALNDHDNVEKRMKAANDKIQRLQKNGTWKEVPICYAKTCILPGTWVFRRKRTPNGTPSASTKHGTVYREIFKKSSRRPLPQSQLGVLYSCFLCFHSHYVGKPAPSTSAARSFKLPVCIQS